jgi:hypothetical protein
MAARVLVAPGQFLLFGQVVERRQQAVGAMLFPLRHTTQSPQRGLQASGQRHKALAKSMALTWSQPQYAKAN